MPSRGVRTAYLLGERRGLTRGAVGGSVVRAGSAPADPDRVGAGPARPVVAHLGDVVAGGQPGAHARVDAVTAVVVLADEVGVAVRSEEREVDVGRAAGRHLVEPVARDV